MKRSIALSLAFVGVLGQYLLGAQAWFSVAMAPDGKTNSLGEFDGFTSFAWLNPMLLVQLLALLLVSISAKTLRYVFLGIATVFAIWVALLTEAFWGQQNLSGLASQIELLTGTALNHGIGLEVHNEPNGFYFECMAAFAAAAFINLAFNQRNWVQRDKSKKVAAKSKGEPNDAIGIWDSQR